MGCGIWRKWVGESQNKPAAEEDAREEEDAVAESFRGCREVVGGKKRRPLE